MEKRYKSDVFKTETKKQKEQEALSKKLMEGIIASYDQEQKM